jgi:hypothetical protein
VRRSRTVDWLILASLLSAYAAIEIAALRNLEIRGYTGLAEGLRPEDVFATLNEHTERVSRVVQENGGTVVEFNGDGMTRELDAAIAIDAPTRERAGYVCGDFVRHADVAIRGRTGRFDVFALPLPREAQRA